MGETKKIVIESNPVEELPEELRRGLESGQMVRVTVESPADDEQLPPPKLTSLVGSARGVYASPEEAVAAIRALRDEWE
jgi:hypothetical protein